MAAATGGAALAAPSAAFAGTADLQECRYANGKPIDLVECEAMRRYAAGEEERKAREAEQRRRADEAIEAERIDRERKRAEEEERRAVARREWREKNEAENRRKDAQEAADRAERKAEAQARSKTVAERKAACGADYLTPRIGMPIDRALQCVGAFRLQGQINRADGVLSTYLGARRYLHVMDGRVVAWGDL